MKTKIKNILSLLTLVAVLSIPALAGAQFDPSREVGSANLSDASFFEVLVTIMQYLLAILTILGVIGFIISGIIYITAAGAGKAEMAQKWLLYSIVGILVGLIGYIVIRLIDNLLNVTVDV